MLMHSAPGCLKQMLDAYDKHGGNVIAVEEVPDDQVSRYGIVGVGEEDETGFRITGMVEKPKREDAPSNLIISGRYILQPEIFDLLADQKPGAGGEIQITDAMKRLAGDAALHRLPLSRPHLRLRHQVRLPHGQRRLCARRAPTSARSFAASSRGCSATKAPDRQRCTRSLRLTTFSDSSASGSVLSVFS